MRILNWLSRKLVGVAEQIGGSLSLRRWDAARTDRQNAAHWAGAKGETVNQDLLLDRDTLVARSMEEVQNNPFVEGVVQTHVSSVVGAEGPILQVISENEEYNDALEAVWWDWWQSPEITKTMSGVDLLQQSIRLLWSNGEFIIQETDDPDEKGISYCLNVIHPRRLRDPIRAANSRIMLGVERDKFGRPTNYYLMDYDSDEFGLTGQSVDPKPYSASRIIHGFKPIEPGQVRGFPWIAPGLQTAADLRDYDRSVLRTARIQANLSVLLETDHPDAPFVNVNEQTDMPESAIGTVPPGWKTKAIQSTQPGPIYKEYRAEKLRELGRPVNMPLMMVMLDSGDHNYSSARFDGQLYNRGILCVQSWLNRILLDRCVRNVERQASLRRMLPPRPGRVDFNWTWPVAPHVDPKKEADAWEKLIDIGGASEFDVAAAMGKDYETVVASQKRAKELREKAGLPERNEKAADVPPDETTSEDQSPRKAKSKQVA